MSNIPSDGSAGTPPAPSSVDELKNIKTEFSRKFENQQSELQELKRMNQEMLAALKGNGQPQASAPAEDIDALWYSNPKAAAEIIKRQTKAEMSKELDSQLKSRDEQTATISSLVNDYPELSNGSDPLTQKTLEIYNSLPVHERASSSGMRYATLAAASELGIKPRSKRNQDNDDSFTGSSSNSGSRSSSKGKRDGELADETLDFARVMGLNVDDPKIKGSLKAHAKRNFFKSER